MRKSLKIGITGASGYLGGRLVDSLSQVESFDILAINRVHSKKKITPNLLNQKFIDWQNPQSISEMCRGLDVIIHCAGTNAKISENDPQSAYEFNGLKTGELIASAIKNGVKKFIYFSTAHVYASPLMGVIDENSCPSNLHPYANSHRLGEDFVRYYTLKNEIEGIVVRLSNSFGSPMEPEVDCWQLLVNDLCKQAHTTKKLILRSRGTQRRDFITLTEVTQVIRFLILANIPKEDSVINAGGNWAPTILEMAELVRDRFVALYNELLEIKILSQDTSQTADTLEFRTERLNQLGYRINQNPIQEIDNLLQFCLNNFQMNKI